jgi:hypothetical protein
MMHEQLWREARLSRLLRREQALLRLGNHEQPIPVGSRGGRLRHAQNVNETLVLCKRCPAEAMTETRVLRRARVTEGFP